MLRRDEDGREYARCAECGTEVDGSHKSLCCCGAKIKGGRSAGLQCVVNPDKSPELPVEIIVRYVGDEKREYHPRNVKIETDDFTDELFDEERYVD